MYWVYSVLLIAILQLPSASAVARNSNTDLKNYETLKEYLSEIDILLTDNISNKNGESLLINDIKQLLQKENTQAFFRAMLAFELLSDFKSAELASTERLHFIKNCLIELNDDNLGPFLEEHPLESIDNFRYLAAFNEMEAFLQNYIYIYPEEILEIYHEIRKTSYAPGILDQLCSVIPSSIKDYLGSKHVVKRDFMDLTSANAMTLKKIYLNNPNDNRMYAFSEEISTGLMTIEEANFICEDDGKYFKEMVKVFLSNDHDKRHSLNKKLQEESLKLMRMLNDDHMNKDFRKRFQPVSNLSAEELYVLIIQSEEEVFTSTFNGLYKMLGEKISGAPSEFLASVNFKEFRIFMRLLASFGKLEHWLGQSQEQEGTDLLRRFVGSLENYRTLDEAITVADAIGSITELEIKETLKKEIQNEFSRCRYSKLERGIAIYRILRSMISTEDLKLFQQQYSITSIDKISKSELFDFNGMHIQQHYFYDDADGRESYASFIAQFSSQWVISDNKTYVVIYAKRNPNVKMFVNKPEHEAEGQEGIRKYFEENSMSPKVIVHRGHSYYSNLTIRHIDAATKIAIIGSCGSYHSAYKLMGKSADVHIISSKQIGSQHVNNPLLLMLAKAIMIEGDLEWQKFWDALESNLRNDSYASEKFADYVPPHKNLGILFVKAFKKLREDQ